jgi:hypothetical protein
MRGVKADLEEVLRVAQIVAGRPGVSLKIGRVLTPRRYRTWAESGRNGEYGGRLIALHYRWRSSPPLPRASSPPVAV